MQAKPFSGCLIAVPSTIISNPFAKDKNMATLMEKERLLNLIAYAESIVLLRVAPADLRDQLTRFLGEQRSRILAAAPETIDLNAIPAIQDIPSKTS